MHDWSSTLQSLLLEYSLQDIFNADETVLFFRLLPDKTLEFKGVDCHGGKKSKERLTVMVCANMAGSEKMPLLVIGKSNKRPMGHITHRRKQFKSINTYDYHNLD